LDGNEDRERNFTGDRMLTIQYEPDGVVEVTVDRAGLEELMGVLRRLSPGDHEHLLTSSWGGYPLTEEFPRPTLIPVHKLTISWDDWSGTG